MSFLTAEWRKLVLYNYEVQPSQLTNYLPSGTELDLWNNRCFVSLVGFMFKNTKILGLKIPFHVNFEEVNLRFYVKRFENGEWKRGVVFVKELVPKAALTLVANSVYKEHYQTLPMKHSWQELGNMNIIEYLWKVDNNWQSVRVTTKPEAVEILPDSETEFITEHYWGYTKIKDNLTYEYEVRHPKWKHYEIIDHDIMVDFKATYGNDFAFLNEMNPCSIMLAEGSEISVEKKRPIQTELA